MYNVLESLYNIPSTQDVHGTEITVTNTQPSTFNTRVIDVTIVSAHIAQNGSAELSIPSSNQPVTLINAEDHRSSTPLHYILPPLVVPVIVLTTLLRQDICQRKGTHMTQGAAKEK